MNKAKLKAYAPQARKDFIAAVTARAHRLGLAEHNGQLAIAPAEKSGDLVIIAGQSWPAKISRQREHLIALIQQDGFNQTMEAVAYTWFNRFAALRYMEIHDYLSHGYRVLSSRAGGLPEILNAAPELAQNRDLPDLNHQQVVELKLAGDQDGELYRLTLIAQCNALSSVMPFLFERIDNETELLLPDNLLLTDSVIAKLVEVIPEEDWSQVEIIGWLYQFYISEKKDQVIGKVVKSEDIPAATQLFTPNWIVQYLVQNSIGRLWLMANPASTLKTQWPYYIEPAEQNPEVQAQLDALIQTRIAEDSPRPEGEGPGVRGTLNPETITVLDPACGSGHILVEAYEVLKAIYLERGYQPRSIPRLILEKNLFGIDIDDRASQLAGFALLMKARADDRRLFDNSPKLNVLALQESKGLDADALTQALAAFVGWVSPQHSGGRNPTSRIDGNSDAKSLGYATLTQPTPASNTVRAELVEAPYIRQLINTFAHAKTFGSLIQIPSDLNAQLSAMDAGLQSAIQSGDLIAQEAALNLLPLVQQAQILGMQFDAVVANPPYMGGKGMNAALKDYAKRTFPDSKSDLFAMFVERGFEWCKPSGFNSMVTMQSWMFLSSFQAMREKLLTHRTINTMAHLGARAFSEISGEVVQTTAFVFHGDYFCGYKPAFFRLVDGQEEQKQTALRSGQNRFDKTVQDDFKKIPGSPLAYWVNREIVNSFSGRKIFDVSTSDGQNKTGDNDKFVRFWWEVTFRSVGRNKKWLTYCKGGEYRKWYGNLENVIDWSPETRAYYRTSERCRIVPEYLWYRVGITWSRVSSKGTPNAFRLLPIDTTFDMVGSSIFIENDNDLKLSLGILNSKLSEVFIPMLNPTIDLQVRDVRNIPYKSGGFGFDKAITNVNLALTVSKENWDTFEFSLDFQNNPLIVGWVSDSVTQQTEATDVGLRDKAANPTYASNNLEQCFNQWQTQNRAAILEMQRLEEENNRLFIEAYGLQDELSPDVPEAQITLARADREKDSQRLISYAIGCMMGRYSLDEPGLIYAHAGNVDFNPDRYNTFPADADGIVPITDELWFEDDAANRIQEFLLAVWNAETLDENTVWLAESLGQKGNETPIETIRRYIAGSFFKDHLQTYKKRPIYWLFSSGKQGAFQALVYLHRYHEGTLARMRAEYVVPLTGKIQSRIEMLEKDAAAADSNASRNKLNKDIEKLKKKHVELLAYDEKLRHYADLRIQLDLDDGVKVNYGKFGDLLAEVKAVTGGASDD
ncbi:MAG: BREX-1 system adenine-specific DNA-methyltransferase PglX [Methylococcaceae bacterium]|nr:BREX-1 system adenine-specific DNA-methyltransferase PglX [Methylococcaceae bacterium]MDZ4155420.1 BREX-1 system adenine-specific DNA-methyltransferase PglX [Methylococcales bacterium]MDP2394282.1 BREX-1 system adenine-specific DNA-methyltransferase PglX [Methylococcaceae bacterium]MDP3019377.1 BREX-1 system adenine-specific DNA-methyltransferase PglX [Methylococcaceae bacterium]MDP3390631.1 BREX-1 system adenine-specific DNA-methyltransferase PglX [Methylococcaceae bacterium]